MYKSNTLLKGALALIAVCCGIIFSSCTEKLSGVGSGYLQDTITSGIHTYSDTTIVRFDQEIKRNITGAYGLTYALNNNATQLFFGKVNNDIEVWAALKVPILTSAIGNVLTDSLILRMESPFTYQYGNSSDQTISFSVWTELGNAVTDSTKTLSVSNLNSIVGSYSGTVSEDSILSISIPLDTSAGFKQLLRTASLALVIVPNSSMNTIRWFASNEIGDSSYAPTLKFLTQGPTDTTTVFLHPTIDFHIVANEYTQVPQGEFFLRGSYAARERITINIDSIRNQLKLNPFATINSGLLQIRQDPSFHTTSNVPEDTSGPAFVLIPNPTYADSGQSFVGFGTSSTVDPDLYGIQIRALIENSLRSGSDSLVIEVCSGLAFRSFLGSSAGVEDYNIDRWMFYGPTAADITKRPKLVITYSYLR